jgi:hypothetical protein
MNKSYLVDAINPAKPKAINFIHEPSHYDFLSEERTLNLKKCWYKGRGGSVMDRRLYTRMQEIKAEQGIYSYRMEVL